MSRPQLVDKNILICTARVCGPHPLLLVPLGHPLHVAGEDMVIVILLSGVRAAGALDCQGEVQSVLSCARLR